MIAVAVMATIVGVFVFAPLKTVVTAIAEAHPVATPAAPEFQTPQIHWITEAEAAAAMGGEVERDDPQALEVEKVGNYLVAHSGTRTSPYTFRFHLVRDTKFASAYALPDGQILITRGLLERLSNESELAGVLGHECGHLVGGHISVLTNWMQLNLSIMSAANVSDRDHIISAESLAGMYARRNALEVKARKNESAADLLALQFLSEAGYDPRGMDGVMRILAQIPIPADWPWAWTHPDAKHRLEDVGLWINQKFPNGIPSNLTEGLPLDHGIPASIVERSHYSRRTPIPPRR